MMKQGRQLLLITAAVLTMIFTGCKKEDDVSFSQPLSTSTSTLKSNLNKDSYSNEVATKWFDLQLALIKSTAGFSPPVASRALGYTGITLYESIVAGMPRNSSLTSRLNYGYILPKLQTNVQYYWPAVANAAMKTMTLSLYASTTPFNKVAINALYNSYHQQFKSNTSDADLVAAEEYGTLVAKAIFEWSKSDGGHEGYANNTPLYTLPVFPGAWKPTFPSLQQTPVQAYWGNNRPFLPSNIHASNTLAPAPLTFSTEKTSAFYKQAKEVYTTSIQLTKNQEDIAHFWADGGGTVTPPGHCINLATQMIRAKDEKLFGAAVIYAKMGMAVADAFIACWKCKYKYNLMRPITYIRENIDPNWHSLITTPAFPSYSSGHSTVSGAAAEVLTAFFGDKVKFTDRTHEQTTNIKSVRSFKSFYEAAEEAAVSRLYGGIHFRMDNEVGLQMGKAIGKNINELKLTNN